MTYQQYIDLGFKRTDTEDLVFFTQTGYYGFFLAYDLNEKASIQVYCDELDKPKLYVLKADNLTNYISEITEEQIKNLLNK